MHHGEDSRRCDAKDRSPSVRTALRCSPIEVPVGGNRDTSVRAAARNNVIQVVESGQSTTGRNSEYCAEVIGSPQRHCSEKVAITALSQTGRI